MYKFIYLLVLSLLIWPTVDNFLNLSSPKVLQGDFVKQENPELLLSSFINTTYQSSKEKYLNENLNLYPFWVRLNNQYLFSTFKETKTFHAIIGKDNYIYDESYIGAYFGDDFVGDDIINNNVSELALFKNVLNKFGKQLVICFLPGKASFYPEKIPNQYKGKEKKITNLEAYEVALRNKNIKTLNLSDFILSAKDTSHYCLYPKNGIHLSTYATVLVAYTLIKFIE